ncbi:MAG: hypothetical protein A3A47_01060 [Candidatus Levybacteria bacterium RIFCSPLOWO2_01_FULL_37_20]|nr:MAG: hypothetical protein A3A47_01060 [Candidatus Levybacteria bacterium RIFCSPLOWO2_01_FULL_37_20]OGH43421.1 MAG: hypothetical protein A3J14_02765 [Candidatus Levybacteria bacterium RIFCSPLOWO2_02_FULL_37_18]
MSVDSRKDYQNMGNPEKPEIQGVVTPPIEEKFRAFLTDEERILNDIAGGAGFTFKRGEGWAINPETGEATYDPKFFEEKGYTPSQALFGAFHEIKCHLVETSELLGTPRGQEAHERLKDRIKAKPRLHIWENCRTDVKGNFAITRFAPSLAEDVEAVYREKLWPETDLTSKPKHLQFMYSILRTAIVPDEQVTIDPEVAEAIKKLRNVKGKDVIALATDPAQDPLLALRLSERYIEPVIEELYQEDLEEKKDQKGKGEKGQGTPEESFADDYEDYESRHPEPMDKEEVEKKIKKTKEQQSESARQSAGYETEHGVSKKDLADYYEEYRQVEGSLEQLRNVFRRIVEQRKIPIRRLAALKEEGVMIDPGLVTQTYLDVKAGVDNPKTMKDFEGRFIEENIPGKFSLRLVADQSGSMAGEKSIHQRRSAILVMEALKEFSDVLDDERAGLSIDLDVQTELRSFGVIGGTRLYKPLSRELPERQRVEFFKGLLETSGETNDYDALAEIEKDVRGNLARDETYAAELKSGKRREIVIVLSDGDSGNAAEVKNRCQNLRELGVKVVGLGMGSGSQSIESTYTPEGRSCYDISDLPKTLQDLLAGILGQLSITGNPEDLAKSGEEI